MTPQIDPPAAAPTVAPTVAPAVAPADPPADPATLAALAAVRVAFGHALDVRDWAAMDTILAPVIDTDLTAMGGPAGPLPRADFVAIFRHAFRHDAVRTFQAYTNFAATVSGDRARMVCLLHGHHAGAGFPGGDTFDLRARYHDGLVRTADGWRLAATRLEVIAVAGNMALVA